MPATISIYYISINLEREPQRGGEEGSTKLLGKHYSFREGSEFYSKNQPNFVYLPFDFFITGSTSEFAWKLITVMTVLFWRKFNGRFCCFLFPFWFLIDFHLISNYKTY